MSGLKNIKSIFNSAVTVENNFSDIMNQAVREMGSKITSVPKGSNTRSTPNHYGNMSEGLREISSSFRKGEIDKDEMKDSISSCLQDYVNNCDVDSLSDSVTCETGSFRKFYSTISGEAKLMDMYSAYNDGGYISYGDSEFSKAYSQYRRDVAHTLNSMKYDDSISVEDYCDSIAKVMSDDIERTNAITNRYSEAVERAREMEAEVFPISNSIDAEFQ